MGNFVSGRYRLRGYFATAAAVCISAVTAAVLSSSTISHQDIAALSNLGDDGTPRWMAHLVEVPTGSSFAASASGIDNTITGSISKTVGVKSGGKPRLLQSNGKVEPLVDNSGPERIDRSLKGGRVVSSTIKRPPSHFNAGSVVDRHSSLLMPSVHPQRSAKFKLKLRKMEPVQVALAFHHKTRPVKRRRPDATRTTLLAGLPFSQLRSSVRAYASTSSGSDDVFSAVLKAIIVPPKGPILGKGDHKWAANALPKGSTSKPQHRCLASGIYFEARGESVRGQQAVAQVILNRVKNPTYPNTICGVVYQNKNWRNRCQFSFACDGHRDRVNSKKHWKTAQNIATASLAGESWIKAVGSSTHYHATYVRPRWARSMKRMKRIGRHIFYRTYGGGWS